MPPSEPYVPPAWSFLPFVLILLAIAVLPLLPGLREWWHHNTNKLFISLVLGLATLSFYFALHPGEDVLHDGTVERLAGGALVLHVLRHSVLDDFVPFIVLLFSLYTISGGILLTGDLQARPRTNCAFLAMGSLLASFIGTTGASMLLIRPLLRANARRRHKVHTVVFFIFLVSNIGGSLTPLGDPPLFLGYLRGVPFHWTLTELFIPWLAMCAALIALYFVWDTLAARSEEREKEEAEGAPVADAAPVEPLRLRGKINFLWLLGVIGCVALIVPGESLPFTEVKPFPFCREILLLSLTLASWIATPRNREIRSANDFDFFAITEVACLFIGIFVCMQPPIEYLREEGARLGLATPAHFFWTTGMFSSFLDNAPTYLVFFETAKALTAADPSGWALVGVDGGAIAYKLLYAISLGSVFMGANTYIGNAPNFMVKSIAEASGVKMPSFFGYMVLSGLILVPLFVILTLVVLR
jgi:Na+/H+ antiporter NhaD/arsenite permease-like protein